MLYHSGSLPGRWDFQRQNSKTLKLLNQISDINVPLLFYNVSGLRDMQPAVVRV